MHTILQKIPKTAVIPLPEYDDGSIMWLNLSRIKYACYNPKEDQLRAHFDDSTTKVFSGAQATAIAQQFDNLSSQYQQRGYTNGN